MSEVIDDQLELLRQEWNYLEAEAQFLIDQYIPVDEQELMTYGQIEGVLLEREPAIYQKLLDLYSQTFAELRL